MSIDAGRLFDEAKVAIEAIALPGGGYKSLNESETRAHLIDPIIRSLGYRTLDEVRLEFQLKASGQFVDYLLVAGETRVVVEAKPVAGDLPAKDASQLVGYCATEGIRWALLTNGRCWQVFDVEVKGNWEAKRVAVIDLWVAHQGGVLGVAASALQYFSRSSLAAGDGDLQAWARGERARTHLDRLLSDPASSVVQSVLHEMKLLGIDLEPSEAVDLLRLGTLARPELVEVPAPPSLSAAVLTAVTPPHEGTGRFVVFPAGDDGGFKAIEHLKAWLSTDRWGVRASSANRKRLAAGDICCFYAQKVGVVARAVVAGPADTLVTPGDWPGPTPFSADVYRVPLTSIHWLPGPVVLDAALRAKLDAFKSKDATKPWGWLIQTTNNLSEHDFQLMTGTAESA